MGLMCSWVAIRTQGKADVLDHLGLAETGKIVEPTERRGLKSAYQNDNGWLYVFAEGDFDWADEARVRDLSQFGLTVGIQAEDKIDMACTVCAAKDGRVLWTVSHINEPGKELTISGEAPAALADIRRKYETLQKEEADADYLWEIPLQLARELTGYRVDEDPIDFRELASTRMGETCGPGLINRLLSIFR
jgi:hypothetical protein